MESAKFDTVIVWFRRDCRVDDNPALVAALQSARSVVPLFIWAPGEEGQFTPGRTSRWWSKQSTIDLANQVASLGSRLILREASDRSTALLQLVDETQAQAVYFNNLYDPVSLASDHEIKRALAARNVSCNSFNSDMLYEPWEVLDSNGHPCTTFEDFWGRVTAKSYPPKLPVPAPSRMPPVDANLHSQDVESISWFQNHAQASASDQLRFKWKPGTPGAISKLEGFLSGKISMFEHDRVKVDRESTSQLSPWIHSGSISIRYIFYRVKQFELQSASSGVDKSQSCSDFLRQMGYREYARYLAFFFPFIHERSLLSHLRSCPWRLDQDAFKAWRQGQTGYPLVDASMKQLSSTGWVHNRLRIVASSFMVKNLLLPWQWGLKHFWDAQLDADLENDALGWQYISGGMADAHPFSYIMDLSSECQRLDPDGEYVRRWLPALALLPTGYIHAPWTAPPEVLEAADVELGTNYPKPIISIQESIVSLQHAVHVLDKASSDANPESSSRHPYRHASQPLKPIAQVSAGTKPTSTAEGTATDGSTEDRFQENASGSRGQSSLGAQLASGQTGGMSGASGSADGGSGGSAGIGIRFNLTYDQVESASSQQHYQNSGAVSAERNGTIQSKVGTSVTAGFDYPKYRQSHGTHKGHYIDVRLVPREAVQAAADAAANGRMHPLKNIPGMRDEAVAIGAMARMIRDSDSAWAAAAGSHRAAGGSEGGREASAGGSSEGDDCDCMSEEVVSNTVGLSNVQASGFSGLMDREPKPPAEDGRLLQGGTNAAAKLQQTCDRDKNMAEGMDEAMSELVGRHKRAWEE